MNSLWILLTPLKSRSSFMNQRTMLSWTRATCLTTRKGGCPRLTISPTSPWMKIWMKTSKVFSNNDYIKRMQLWKIGIRMKMSEILRFKTSIWLRGKSSRLKSIATGRGSRKDQAGGVSGKVLIISLLAEEVHLSSRLWTNIGLSLTHICSHLSPLMKVICNKFTTSSTKFRSRRLKRTWIGTLLTAV